MRQLLAGLALVAVSVLAATARRTVDYALNRLVDVIPVLVLRLARRRLPATARDDLYRDWHADLIDRRHDPELTGRPLAQLKSCTRDSLGWLRSGRAIAATYRDPSPGVRLELVQERLRTLCERGGLPWLRQRDGLRQLALHLRWLLDEPTLAFTAEEKAQLVAAAAIAGKLCVDDRDERLGQELVDAAWPHADDLGFDHTAVLHLLHTTGYVALQLGDHDEAGEILADVGDRLAAAFGEDHPAALEARRLRAWNLQEQGQLDDAEQGLNTILEALEQASDADLAQRLHVLCMLGWTQCQQALRDMRDGHTERAERRFDQAEATYDAVIFGRATLLGPDHHDTLDARHSLGKVIFARGDCRQAQDVLQQVAADRWRCTNAAHPDTLESRKYVALAAAGLGRRHEAKAELRRILDTQTQVQGPSHPKTRDTHRWLHTLTQEMT